MCSLKTSKYKTCLLDCVHHSYVIVTEAALVEVHLPPEVPLRLRLALEPFDDVSRFRLRSMSHTRSSFKPQFAYVKIVAADDAWEMHERMRRAGCESADVEFPAEEELLSE